MRGCFVRYYSQWYYELLDYDCEKESTTTLASFRIPNPGYIESDKREEHYFVDIIAYSFEELKTSYPELFL